MLQDGAPVGRLRSVAYGYTVERMLAYAYLPVTIVEGAVLTVETLAGPVAATVAGDRLVDPEGLRMQ